MMREVIARGNGNYIAGVACKVSKENGYKSMWAFTDAPILRSDRRYLLWQDEKGALSVERQS